MSESKRKFYRTVFTVEVLSEEPIRPDIDLVDLAYEITDGHASGRMDITEGKVLTGPQAAVALKAQGSDPEFFQLNDKGEDIE